MILAKKCEHDRWPLTHPVKSIEPILKEVDGQLSVINSAVAIALIFNGVVDLFLR